MVQILFQLTRPRGARRVNPKFLAGAVSFNSRAREGRDFLFFMFISAPAGFNSRAREGRDREMDVRSGLYGRFNSRAREGRDAGPECEALG